MKDLYLNNLAKQHLSLQVFQHLSLHHITRFNGHPAKALVPGCLGQGGTIDFILGGQKVKSALGETSIWMDEAEKVPPRKQVPPGFRDFLMIFKNLQT